MTPAKYWSALSPEEKQALAARSSLAYSTLSAVLAGGKRIGATAALRLERLTGGKLRASELRPDLFKGVKR